MTPPEFPALELAFGRALRDGDALHPDARARYFEGLALLMHEVVSGHHVEVVDIEGDDLQGEGFGEGRRRVGEKRAGRVVRVRAGARGVAGERPRG